jgi:hypothetical protein
MAVAERIARGEAVTALGVPEGFGDAKGLVTGDCIQVNRLAEARPLPLAEREAYT